jgi:hypothetical protein
VPVIGINFLSPMNVSESGYSNFDSNGMGMVKLQADSFTPGNFMLTITALSESYS